MTVDPKEPVPPVIRTMPSSKFNVTFARPQRSETSQYNSLILRESHFISEQGDMPCCV